jgi:hypothetical protein
MVELAAKVLAGLSTADRVESRLGALEFTDGAPSAKGISAPRLAARYGASLADAGKIPELAPAGEPRIRLHDLAGRHHLGGHQQVPTNEMSRHSQQTWSQ